MHLGSVLTGLVKTVCILDWDKLSLLLLDNSLSMVVFFAMSKYGLTLAIFPKPSHRVFWALLFQSLKNQPLDPVLFVLNILLLPL
jgi:hypothetical protein